MSSRFSTSFQNIEKDPKLTIFIFQFQFENMKYVQNHATFFSNFGSKNLKSGFFKFQFDFFREKQNNAKKGTFTFSRYITFFLFYRNTSFLV